MGLSIIIGIIIILAFVVFILGIGTDFVDDVFKRIDESQEKQKDQADPSITDIGNFAKDIKGARVCDLRIRFVGIITGHDLYGLFDFSDQIFLWFGAHPLVTILTSFPDFNENIIEYQWFCQDQNTQPLSLLSWNLGKNLAFLTPPTSNTLTPNSILDLEQLVLFGQKSDGETVRIKFIGESKTTGKSLFTPTNSKVQFQGSQRLPIDGDFPQALEITIYLEDVTEDDYRIRFWSDTERIGISGASKALGERFMKDICVPGKSTC